MSKIDNTNMEPAIRALDDAELDIVSGGLGFWDDGGCTPHWTGHGWYNPQLPQPTISPFSQKIIAA